MRTKYTDFVWGLTGERQEMLVEDGRVLARGAKVDDQAEAEIVACNGRTLSPSWIDNHCHILPTGIDLSRLNLGVCDSRDAVLDAVRECVPATGPGQWLRAVHYDQTKFPDGRHLTRWELDAVSSETPILLRHVNGHASVANSRALECAGIAETEADPPGGTFSRDSSGRMDGVLLERAHEKVSAAAPKPNLEDMVGAIMLAGQRMSEVGLCCAADMMTGQFDLDLELQAYRIAAERGCPVRNRLYLQWAAVFGPRALPRARIEELIEGVDPDRCRIAGIKIFADGAIGSATAAIYGSYSSAEQPTGADEGQLIYAPDRLAKMVRVAHDAGFQIAIHSIGDRSTDVVMDAYEVLGSPAGHRIEHAMLLSDSQIERMARLGLFCTMQPEFLVRFGHSYRRHLGDERASRLKRFRSVLDAGIPLSFSSDRPIVAGDPAVGMQCATKRPDGFDPAECATPAEAVRAYTVEAAKAMGDRGFGGLEPGQAAEVRLD